MARKYAVLKMDDWELLVGRDDALLLADAEVIRGQDLTAAPIFHAYANIIGSFIELMPYLPTAARGRCDELLAIADHFHEAALASEARVDRKLPD